MNRTLILACSATKRKDPGLMPAIHRYDGPAYRTLKASRHENVRLFILSAEHGLISGGHPIADYDRKMDEERAAELVQLVASEIRRHALVRPLGSIFFHGSAVYRTAMQGALAQVGLLGGATFSCGGIGDQLGQLKRWLAKEDA